MRTSLGPLFAFPALTPFPALASQSYRQSRNRRLRKKASQVARLRSRVFVEAHVMQPLNIMLGPIIQRAVRVTSICR